MASFAKDKSSKPATRPSAFNDSDDEDGSPQNGLSSQNEEIVSFSRDGAQRRRASPKPAAPLIIPVASNLDWRQDRKQRLGIVSNLQSLCPLVSMRRGDFSAVPGAGTSSKSTVDLDADAINTEEQKRGLELRTSRPRQDEAAEHSSADASTLDPLASTEAPTTTSEEAGTDQEALKALLAGEGVGTSNTGEPLIIPQESDPEMLQHDIDSRPEAPTLDDYAATPIDQFGMALLRGMGWKEGMGAGKGGKGPQQAAEPKKRAALLGLGAKERPAGSTSLLSSSSSRRHKPKDRRDYKYVPVIKRDSQGGSNGRSSTPESRPREDRHADDRSRDIPAHLNDRRSDRDSRHSSSRDSPRHESSRSSSHRHRSRSPMSSKSKDHDRHCERRRDDRGSERRSHASSRSDRDRDDRRRDHRR
ncbi:related to Pre-mRNA-splicing factor SPP2 [Ustilago sp. UG-2017b]|nr:related to Pre-mRNA-splicing factor SPP2 [Ustilago sp. UG-2017b]